ncbi:phytoene/squalene synthase family protein [Arsenicicoccus sp. oral taxon 190]|uniref:phytoene/squalene synthase family protein n=1 Tax=Arsenicicoccus sp. oral taxon 190 TaxID=1658671 RepID=UPI00067A1C11|nr:phytoene/squalene synthase family protein [Arsenicicoccus sp. oral taxon 190]AKT50330.1 phytoene synthase [Arsenicicoccus sp. oral taxon 190]
MSVPGPLELEGYRRCAAITRRHGTTYYWGVALLPLERRRHVHAVYALCRAADDIVDDEGATSPEQVAQTTRRLEAFRHTVLQAVDGAPVDDPVLAAVVRTLRSCALDQAVLDRFFGAMAADLTTTRYETWEDLLGYMDGSAAVIGEMMLPVLRPTTPEALGPARALGLAFQLTNFIRDVAEDLDRGRVYLPQADLRAHGADPALRRVTPQWRTFLAEQIERNRALYAEADRGIPLLPGASARCVATARLLYSQILDRIEAADHDVFSSRIRVPTPVKAATAARALVRLPAPVPA